MVVRAAHEVIQVTRRRSGRANRGQLFIVKVSKQTEWYALGCSLSVTVKLMGLPWEKESVWLVPHPPLPEGCVREMTTVSAVAGWTVVPLVVSLIDPLASRVPLVPP